MTARSRVREGYDRVAHHYRDRFSGELDHKPHDRALLDRLADELRGRGTVCDLGCGPGHVARYLHQRGVDVLGVDLSEQMVSLARQASPGIPFRTGDMLDLDGEEAAWAGIVALYSIIHVPRERVTDALGEMRRALRPGGRLLLAFHLGDETVHLDEWWGEAVSLDFHLFARAEMEGFLGQAGLAVDEVLERDPYPDVEAQTRRCYVFARKLGGG